MNQNADKYGLSESEELNKKIKQNIDLWKNNFEPIKWETIIPNSALFDSEADEGSQTLDFEWTVSLTQMIASQISDGYYKSDIEKSLSSAIETLIKTGLYQSNDPNSVAFFLSSTSAENP